ncbi:NAD(+) diphosphatase [Parerythrobacter jejuensis]|uniref:NAD(+) diphosphatase n=1 Tax=Parerythrobacter jejuensis TaxID=795812 RepID=A0A845AVJ6_9SPHN|nr:NAD(+) diphosphatase [Parerythrobacter jejuensis]MXP32821.1 NAD(+) diphosphatase [Parerythrobacter jejuensis]
MTAQGAIAFSGSPIDRADHVRADPERLAGYMNWKARFLALDGLMPSLDDNGRLAWGSLADAADDAELVFLGIDRTDGGEKACFAAVPAQGDASPRMANPQLWSLMATLDPGDLATYGGARSLIDWHARHRFCAQCGASTKIAKGGWQRGCDSCKAQHFPRTDPVTIMLAEHEGRLMLGRGKGWPEGAFSALAGFVEPGETIEEAVQREVYEEAGVRVRDVSYVASQPWPFPSQLMIGCHSHADNDELVIDETEMAEVRFFTREEVVASLEGSGPFRAPPKHAIAHNLMQWWLNT